MLNSLTDALKDQIRDLYSAEHQLTQALPKMAEHATSKNLRKAIEGHLRETEEHAQRLEKVAQMLEIKPGGKKCKAMEGLIEEGKEALKADGAPAVIDVAIIAAAQRVEHYEIAAYGTVRALAESLGRSDIASIIQKTLDEEKAADSKLTEISESEVLQAAAGTDQAAKR